MDPTDWFEEKIDLQTNNPRKLFRAITDLFEDEISKRGYVEILSETPKLEETGVEGVADFEGYVDARKVHHTRTKKRILSGIVVILVGISGFLISDYSGTALTGPQASLFNFLWIIPVIVGIAIILFRSSIEMIIGVYMEGEGYQYRGKKQTSLSETKRERLDVLSDVRLTLYGQTEHGTTLNDFYKKELGNDVDYISEQLAQIVPEYRIPNQDQK